MRASSRSLVLLLLAAAALSACQGSRLALHHNERTAPASPNIIFIYSDDHANAAIGAYDSWLGDAVKTPNIDRLAQEGLRFDRAFCTNSICGPARAVVLTGKHSHLNGVRDNAPGTVFDPASDTFPKRLQANGYQTAMIGKWHLGSDPTGFDHWEVLPGQGRYYSPQFRRPDANGKTEKVTYPGYVTEVTTDLALDWLQNERDPQKPFMLMMQHKAPHRSWMPGPNELALYEGVQFPEPATLFDDYAGRAAGASHQEMTIANHMWMYYDLMVPPIEGELGFDDPSKLKGPDRWASGWEKLMSPAELAAWKAHFEPANALYRQQRDAGELEGDALTRWKFQRYMEDYLACINGVDKSVGEVLAWLESSGMADNTIVIYSSDQGFYLGEHGWYDKRWMYEQSLRLPLILRWPGVVAAGTTDAHLVQNLDLAPTFLELAGATIPDDMQGLSLVPLLLGEAPPWRDAIYYEYYEKGVHNVPPHFGVRTERYKLIRYDELAAWELFDLDADPNELHSVVDDAKYAEIRRGLEARLAELRTQYKR